MTQHAQEIPFKLFHINSGSLAQPAYTICTAFRNPGNHLKSECFILIQSSLSEGHLFGSRFSYSESPDDSLIVMDEAFAMEDALSQAETIYSIRARELDPKLIEKLGWARPRFEELPLHRLRGIWIHTPLSRYLLSVADKTNCEMLSKFLYSLSGLPTAKQTVLTF